MMILIKLMRKKEEVAKNETSGMGKLFSVVWVFLFFPSVLLHDTELGCEEGREKCLSYFLSHSSDDDEHDEEETHLL